MNAPLHTFAKRPVGFGRRGVPIAEIRARVNRRAAIREAIRDLLLLVALPLAVGFGIINLGGL